MINGKAIYTTKGAALEYGRTGCNFYIGCPHNCGYCYLKRGAPSKLLGGTEVRLKSCFKDEGDALGVFCGEVRKHIDTLRETGVFFSFTTDPMIPETRDLTISALNMLTVSGVPAVILTKDARWLQYRRAQLLLRSIAENGYDVRFGFTLTGRDDMEPGASSNAERIEAMRQIKKLGVSTWASIEPVVDWDSSVRVVGKTLNFCDHYKIGLRSGVNKDYYDDNTTARSLVWLKHTILDAGSTMYFKESVRKRFEAITQPGSLEGLLEDTLDVDGNVIKAECHEENHV